MSRRPTLPRHDRRGLLRLGLALPFLPLAPGAGWAHGRPVRLGAVAQHLADAVEAELRRVEAALQTAVVVLEPRTGGTGLSVLLPAADRLVRATAASLGLPVIALDSRLTPFVDSAVPSGVALPASPAAEVAADALDGMRPVAGLVTRLVGGPAVAVAVPAPGPGGRPIAVLVALLPAERLAAAMSAALSAEAAGDIAWARLEAAAEGAAPQPVAEARPPGAPAEASADLTTFARPLRYQPHFSVSLGVLPEALPLPPTRPGPEPPPEPLPASWLAGAAGIAGLLAGTVIARRRRPRAEPPRHHPGEQEAHQALSELRAICDTIPVGLALLDANGRLLSANKRLAAFAGLPEDALPGRHATAVLPPLLAETVEAAHLQVMRSGRAVLDVPVAVEASGSLRHTRHLLVSCHPVRDATRRVEAVSAAVQDVTERTRAEAGRNLLVRELNHRVKNCLATVQTIAQQTLRNAGGDMGEFARGFGERIRALARAHDLLTVHAWGDAELLAVARAALSPWLDDRRLMIDPGPPVMLRPAQAQALVLAFNELATNAAKYGALTREEGQVRLRWTLDGEGMAQLAWTETGGPSVATPTRRGFGTRLLEQALRHDLGGGAESKIAFEASGLSVAIRFRPGGMVQQKAAA